MLHWLRVFYCFEAIKYSEHHINNNMFHKRSLLRKLGLTLLALCVIFTAINVFIVRSTRSLIFQDSNDLENAQVALILGAKVFPNGNVSDILKDRLLSGLELYELGLVEKILVSGDNGQEEYDEVNAMKDFLIEKGVAPEDIFMDHAGFDTYDSLYRAKAIFGVESAILVTQAFHLPRALYIGRALDIEVSGFVADKQDYFGIEKTKQREAAARIKAFLNVTFHSKPKYLGEEISITGNGEKSWD